MGFVAFVAPAFVTLNLIWYFCFRMS